jgi:Leucine-rich repeat (LRR) protein
VRLEQLKNLKQLVDLNLQYNQIQEIPELSQEDFPALEALNLAYNKLNYLSVQVLMQVRRLKLLDLTAN